MESASADFHDSSFTRKEQPVTGTAFDPGQLAEFTSNVSSALAIAMPRVANKFGDPEQVLAYIKDKTEILAVRLATAIEEVVEEVVRGMALIHRPQLSITISNSDHCNPDSFFQTRDGCFAWSDFRNRMVKLAKPVDADTTFKVNVDDLGADLMGNEIEIGLPQNHFWDEGALCAVIAEMISKQPGGKKGDLLNNSHNLFYTQSCVVTLYWTSYRQKWYVRTWRRNGRGWSAGSRVLTCAN